MIQSGKFDSSNMDIKKLGNSVLIFIIKRLIEIFGIFVLCSGILLSLSLISYSPSDPNFIFSDNIEVKNLLGFQGSYVSDFFLQSVGLISFLIPLTFLFSGINIFKQKKIFFCRRQKNIRQCCLPRCFPDPARRSPLIRPLQPKQSLTITHRGCCSKFGLFPHSWLYCALLSWDIRS